LLGEKQPFIKSIPEVKQHLKRTQQHLSGKKDERSGLNNKITHARN